MHGAYHVTKGERGSFDRVMRGLAHLRDAGVLWNALATVHAANGDRGCDVYRFLRDECGARFVQFIPIVERVAEATEDGTVPWTPWRDRPLYVHEGDRVTGRSVTAEPYGCFLIDVFEEWVRRDVGERPGIRRGSTGRTSSRPAPAPGSNCPRTAFHTVLSHSRVLHADRLAGVDACFEGTARPAGGPVFSRRRHRERREDPPSGEPNARWRSPRRR